jgi:gentisate 1,2-dioxygenase
MEMHRLAAGTSTMTTRVVGSSVWQVFDGTGTVELDGTATEVAPGDVFVVPSWCPATVASENGLDVFMFSDAPVYEALNLGSPEGRAT